MPTAVLFPAPQHDPPTNNHHRLPPPAHTTTTSSPNGTILSSTINLSNTIMGAGMLSMPYALSVVGLGLGSLFILGAGLASLFGLVLLSKCAGMLQGNRQRSASFYSVTSIAYPRLTTLFDATIAIKCFGVSISYLVICGNLMPNVISSALHETIPMTASPVFWISVCMAAMAPAAFARRLDSLKYTSSLALVAVVYLVAVVVGYALVWPEGMPIGGWIKWSDIKWADDDWMRILKIAPVFVFAFTCHQNIFSVHNELIDNSLTRKNIVITSSIAAAIVNYSLIAVFGYLSFASLGDGLFKPNVIQMYPTSPIITVGQVAITLLVLLSYPLQCHPCRASLDKVIDACLPPTRVISQEDAEDQAGHEEQDATTTTTTTTTIVPPPSSPAAVIKEIPQTRFIALTTGIIISSYILAISVRNLSTVLQFVGATGSTTICYILPGILYHKMSVNRIHALQSELGSGYEADDGERGPLLGGGGGGGGEEGYYGTNNSNNTNNNIRSSLSSPTSATNLLRDFKRKELALLLSPAARLERTMALALAGFGVCFMAVSLYMQFFGGSGGSSPGH